MLELKKQKLINYSEAIISFFKKKNNIKNNNKN